MSAKEVALRAIQELPDTTGFRQILEALRLARATEAALRRYDETGQFDDDLTDEEWRQFVAYSLRDELSDARQDIYTEDAGERPDATR